MACVATDAAVQRAWDLLLKGTPGLRWDEFDQVKDQVMASNPNASCEKLYELIVNAAVKQWTSGMGCCS